MSRLGTNRHSNIVITLGPSDEKLVPIAQDVAIERATIVCEVMFHIAAIRSLQHAPARGATALVECLKARLQDRTATGEHQAAHLLPGQIRIANLPVWELAASGGGGVRNDDLARLEARTQSCFALTWVLPSVFNRADSQAEKMAGNDGLKRLFGMAVHQLWRTARTEQAQPLVIDRHAVLTALQTWFRDVNDCYERAADRKREAWTVGTLEQNPRSDDRRRESTILATYADSLKIVNVARFINARLPEIESQYRFL